MKPFLKTVAAGALLAGPFLVPAHAQVDVPTVSGSAPVSPAPDAAPDSTATPPPAPAPEKPRLLIGPEVSVFLPSSSNTRDRFGKSWTGFGVGFGSVHQNGLLGRTSGEFYLLDHSHDGNRAYVLPVGIAYRRDLSGGNGARPYVGAGLNVIPTYFKVQNGVAEEDKLGYKLRFGAGGSLIAGTTFGPKGYFEARYLLTSKISGYDFTGLNLTLGIRF